MDTAVLGGMLPHSVAGSYVNYVSDEGDALARAAYGPNHGRLVCLENNTSPQTFFRMNHNIKRNR